MSFSKALLIFSLLLLLLYPAVSLADDGFGFVTTFPYWGANPPILPCHGVDCRSTCDFTYLLQRTFWFLLSVGIFGLAPLAIAVGGTMLLVGSASPPILAMGKKALTGAAIDIVFGLLAWLIVNTLVHVLGVSGSGNGQVGGFGAPIACDYEALTLGTDGGGNAPYTSESGRDAELPATLASTICSPGNAFSRSGSQIIDEAQASCDAPQCPLYVPNSGDPDLFITKNVSDPSGKEEAVEAARAHACKVPLTAKVYIYDGLNYADLTNYFYCDDPAYATHLTNDDAAYILPGDSGFLMNASGLGTTAPGDIVGQGWLVTVNHEFGHLSEDNTIGPNGSPQWLALHNDPNGYFVSQYGNCDPTQCDAQAEDFAETWTACVEYHCQANNVPGLTPAQSSALQKKFDYIESIRAVCSP